MVSKNLDKIVTGNGLVPDGTKPLPESMLTNHQVRSGGIPLKASSVDMLKISILDIILKITD